MPILHCTCPLFRNTSECGHVLAVLGQKKLIQVPTALGTFKQKSKKHGWVEKVTEKPLESHDEPIAAEAEDALVLPSTFEKQCQRLWAASSAAKVNSFCFLLSSQQRPQKITNLLLVDHSVSECSVAWTEEGIQTLSNYLLKHEDLLLKGAAISHHAGSSAVVPSDVMVAYLAGELRGSDSGSTYCVVSWKRGAELVEGTKIFRLAHSTMPLLKERGGRVTAAEDADDFVRAVNDVREDYALRIKISGSLVKHEIAPKARPSGPLRLNTAGNDLMLGPMGFDYLHTIAKLNEDKSERLG